MQDEISAAQLLRLLLDIQQNAHLAGSWQIEAAQVFPRRPSVRVDDNACIVKARLFRQALDGRLQALYIAIQLMQHLLQYSQKVSVQAVRQSASPVQLVVDEVDLRHFRIARFSREQTADPVVDLPADNEAGAPTTDGLLSDSHGCEAQRCVILPDVLQEATALWVRPIEQLLQNIRQLLERLQPH